MKVGRLLVLACGLGACAQAAPAVLPTPAAAPDSAVTHRFYDSRPYGSEAEFNPLSTIVNEGFDQLRTSSYRNLLTVQYRASAVVVLHSLANPERVLRHYGYRNWLRNEVFPLTTKAQGGGQWVPNYQLHLFGAGMTYARLTEWYEQHGFVAHPRILAGVTAMAFHFLNEMIETGPTFQDDEDSLTDLMIFDPASIILWNQSWVLHRFDGRLEMTDWQGQASIGEPGTTIEDAYSMVMLRAPLPRTDNWKVMTTAGNAFLLGVSRRLGTEYWLSASGGFDPSDNPVIDPRTNTKTATLLPDVGAFVDRNGSLLASFISKGGSNNGPTVNVYPGVLRFRGVSPGVWVQGIRGGGLRFGIESRIGLGLAGYAFTPHQAR